MKYSPTIRMKKKTKRIATNCIALVVTLTLVFWQTPIGWAVSGSSSADEAASDAAQSEQVAAPEQSTTEAPAASEPEPAASSGEVQVTATASADKEQATATIKATTNTEVDTGEVVQQAAVDVDLSLHHAYLVYGGQNVAAPATKLTIPEGSDLVFSAIADNGYELYSVVLTVGGSDRELASNSSGQYLVSSADVASGATITALAEPEGEALGESAIERNAQADFEYSDDAVKVTAKLTKPESLPAGVELSVTPVTKNAKGYNYDAYLQALNDSSDADESYSEENTLLYDVAFMGPRFDEEGNAVAGELVEYEPEAGTVSITIEFKKSQLSGDIDGQGSEAVEIKHLPLRDSVRDSVDSTEAATDISASDIIVENVMKPEANVGQDEVSFTVDSLSVVAVTTLAAKAAAAEPAAEASDAELLAAAAADDLPVAINASNATVTFGIYKTAEDRAAGANPLTASDEIGVADMLYGKLHYDFKPGEGPKEGRLNYAYVLPSSLDVKDKVSTTLYDESNNVAGTWEIVNNIVYFHYDLSWAQKHPNGGGNFSFDFKLDEDSVETGEETSFQFPGATDTLTVKVKEGDLTGQKTNAGVNADGTVDYTVSLHAECDFEHFEFTDLLEKSLNYVEGSFMIDGQPMSVTITENANGTHTSKATSVSSITKGDHVITYRTKIDQAVYNNMSNWEVMPNTRNTAKWTFSNDGEPKSHESPSWLWVQKNIVQKWSGAIWDGNKVLWTVKINGSDQYKVDLAGYTFTDTLKEGHKYWGHFELRDANQNFIKNVDIDPNSDTFSYTFPDDAGANTYYLMYYTVIDDPTKAATLSNDGTVTPPGGTPTTTTGTKDYNPGSSGGTGTGEDDGTPKPEVTKEVLDESQAAQTGIVTWHSTLTSENYPEPEATSGLVLQYYDTLDKWANNHPFDGRNGVYYTIWFVGEPSLSAGGKKLVKGVDYQFDEQGGRTYGYTWYSKNFEGESVPIAFRIRFILDSDTMKDVVANKTPIDIYYDTMCDGTQMTYYNRGQARITSGNTEVYGSAEKEAQYTLKGDSQVVKLGYLSFDESLGQYVVEWNVYVNRDQYNWTPMSDLQSGLVTIMDTLPEGMTYIEGSGWSNVHREANDKHDYWSPDGYPVQVKQDGTSLRVDVDLATPVNDNGKPRTMAVYDEETGAYSCYASLHVKFKTALDPAYVVHDGTEQTLRNTATATAGGKTLGTGNAGVTYRDTVLEKTGSQESGAPVVHYTIKVNPKGEKLDPESTHTVISLKDTLDYRTTVVLSSVKITNMKTNEDITGDCTVLLNNNEQDASGNQTASFTIRVPDATPVKVDYDVSLAGKIGSSQEVTNTASLEGITGGKTQNKNWYKVNKADASVYGSANIISIVKSDSNNVLGEPLEGAEFLLYRVDLSKLGSGAYTEESLANASTKVGGATTNEYGQATLFETDSESLQYDTLYYFQEVKAPEGYAIDDPSPHFVMLEGDNYYTALEAAESHGISPSQKVTYNITDTEKTSTFIEAHKVLEGADIEAGEFSFQLKEGDTILQTKTNDSNGDVVFDDIVYDKVGEHEYTIVEVTGDKPGIDYDTHAAKVTVKVTNAGNGRYAAEVVYDEAAPATFTNTYSANGKVTLRGKKTLQGDALADGQFSFKVMEGDKEIATVTNKADGTIDFPTIAYTLADLGTHTYTVTEVAGGDSSIAYDGTEYTVTVEVADDVKDGELEVNASDNAVALNFSNEKRIEISGTKTWDDAENQDGIRPGSIVVNLMDGDTVVASQKVTGTGDVWNYTFSDLPKYRDGAEISYTVEEVPVGGYTAKVEGSNLTNTHKPETISVVGTKTWVDADNQDGIRPDSVKVHLFADGTEIDSKDVTKANNWAYSFDGLAKYRDEGTEIKYTVTEDVPTGYTGSIDGYYLTNTHTPEKTKVEGTKTWDDNDNQDGIRPDSITVRLLANGVKKDEQTVSAENAWAYSFANLDKYANGAEIAYTVEEVPVAGYVASVTDKGITNTHTPKKTTMSGAKAWDDRGNQDGVRPESIVINLLADGVKVDSKTVTAESDWAWSFVDLDKYAGGREIKYTVSEEEVADYSTTYAGMNVTNTHTPGITSVSGQKAWNDGNNQDNYRPESITVNLLADGVKVDSKVVTPDEDGNWTYSFTNLPEKKDGKEIVYSISEEPVDHYTAAVDGYNLINTHEVEKVDVAGMKTWDDGNDQDGKRPESITVHLLANGKDTGKVATANAAGGWKYSFEGLDAKAAGETIAYTVVEEPVDGYTPAYDGMNITNAHTPETTEIPVSKVWNDNENQDGKRPQSITVRVLKGEQEVASHEVKAADNNWSWTFTDLPKYENGKEIPYTVTEDEVDGYETSIAVTDDGVVVTNTHTPEKTRIEGTKTWDDNENQDGKRPANLKVTLYADEGYADEQIVAPDAQGSWSYAFENLDAYKDGKKIEYTVSEEAVEGYVSEQNGDSFINKHTPETTEVTVKKTWDDANNQDGKRPESITVRLFANDTLKDTATVSASDQWSWTFENLPKYENGNEISYTVTEDKVDGYDTSIEGTVITNAHTPETVTISGVKSWEDSDNRDGLRPLSITVKLLANDREIASVVTNAANGWAYSFGEQPKYKDGKEISYRVEEEAVKGYESAVSGYDLVNTHEAETTEVSGTKTWDDENNRENLRPDSITVRLLADGTEVATKTVTEADNWHYEFKELPKNAAGEEIEYAVVEDVPEGYTAVYASNGYDIVNKSKTTSISGVKTWEDAQDQDGKRPTSITVNLLADGEQFRSLSVAPDATGRWAFTFDNVPKYREDGTEIEYTLSEVPVEGYTTEIDGTTIVNTHTPETISVEGTKTWVDGENQDGKRPKSITVHLLADNVEVASKSVSAEDNWAYQFENLPKYAKGKEIAYTVTEDEVTGYESSVDGYYLTNWYTPETTSVSGVKTWNDSNDRDGKRPESITVRLLANGTEVQTKTVTAENDWQYRFDNLPVYDQGNKITYTIEEGGVTGYTAAENAAGFVNTHETEKVSVSGKKTWNDANDQDGLRPDSITVNLTANGKVVQTQTANEADGWSYAFNNLPKYENGVEIAYGITESAVTGYTATFDGYDIANTHTPATTEVSGTKTWNDKDNQDGIRPASITVRLLADGVEVQSKEVTAENSWEYSFTGLPVNKAGKPIAYTVVEDEVDGYDTAVDGSDIVNTHTPLTTEVSGTKTWNDSNDQDGKRPESITINLMANGEKVNSKTLTEETGWNYTFRDLPVNKAGKAIEYTITEDTVAGYTTEIDGFDVTNSYVPDTTAVSGAKTWNDSNDQDGLRPDSITVRLLADGTEVQSRTVTADDDWAYSFENLPMNRDHGTAIEYTVVEDSVAGYETTYDGYDITNTHKPGVTAVSGAKKWNDANNRDGLRPSSITVHLLADGVEVDSAEVSADENGIWSYSFTDLPVNKVGKPITYTVTEDTVEGYDTEIDGANITNTHTPATTEVVGTKTWVDADDQDGIRPASVTIRLLANGSEVAHKNVSAADNWAYAFNDLPKFEGGKEISYTITEDAVDGYTTKVDGAYVTNTHEVEKTSVSGTKTWDDADNQDGIRPASITVNLLANGVKQESKTVSATSGWTYSFENLDKYANGKLIKYTVTEDAVEGYTTTLDGYDFTNAHIPATTEVSGSKTWVDNGNQDGKRPASITVNLLADGKKVDEATVAPDAQGNWSYAFTDLAKFQSGKEISYTVSEEAVDDYDSAASGTSFTNAHEVEKVSVSGTKTWVDENDQDGKRPASITVRLYADGTEIDSKTVTAEDSWKYSFENLDKYANGKEISYTVSEDAVEGYTTERDGFNFTNTHEVEKTSVSGSKTWVDADDQDGVRPDSITVNLLANGTKKASQTVSAANGWSYSFDNLDKYANGEEIEYTVTEDAVRDYESATIGYDLVNTHETEKTSLSGTKTWNDADNQDGIRPEAIVVNLLAEGEVVESKTVTASDNWSYAFNGLAKYRDHGTEIEYAITEDAIEGYAAEYDGANITNTHAPGKTSVSGTKTWNDASDQDGIRPDSITVRLLANGNEIAVQEVTPDANGIWSYSFTDLPEFEAGKAVAYSVAEDAVEGYETTVTGYDLQNTHEVEKVEVSGVKTWNDANNQDGIRPDGITVHLLANGEEIATTEATAENDWAWTFGELDKNAAGAEIEYTVVEDEVSGYAGEVSGAVEDGFTLVNTRLAHENFKFEKYHFVGTGTFDFKLTAVDSAGAPRTGAPLVAGDDGAVLDDGSGSLELTVQNGAYEGGSAPIEFPELRYTEDGDYYYLVEEDATSGAEMVADAAQYLIHVTVANGKVSNTTYELLYEGENLGETDDLSFYNNSGLSLGIQSLSMAGYTQQAEKTSVYPEVKKYLNGSTDMLVGGDFAFELADAASGVVIATASNDAAGNVAFFDESSSEGLVYTEPGAYSYTIREVEGNDTAVTYDRNVITLTVTVTEDADGLHAQTGYSGYAGDEPAFYNTVEGMNVTVQKVSRYGGEGLVDCTYALWMVGENGDVMIKEATSDANGYITFTDVSLMQGQRYYFKEVEAPAGHTVDPYRTAYFALNEAGDQLVLVEATAADGWHSATENIEIDKAREAN